VSVNVCVAAGPALVRLLGGSTTNPALPALVDAGAL
jgi:hypothetical protein